MIPIDFARAQAFLAAVPRGRWTSFKDVATAGGNERAPQAIGGWLRRDGDKLPHVHRVLTIDGLVPEGFRPAGPGIPRDAHGVRALLEQEGVRCDGEGRALASQRFRAEHWRPA
jgi:alkylated DNA nucleotide flippase Atl1